METTTFTLTRRPVLTALAVAFLALLLAALTAAPAGAKPRSPAVEKANDMIAWCFNNGGEPDVIMDTTGTSIIVVCDYGDHTEYCDVSSGTAECTTVTEITAVDPVVSPLQRGSRSQLTPVGTTTLEVRPGTHLELSGGRLILVADKR